jgi:alpha-tubulin suppressor-like RCC1 family protein
MPQINTSNIQATIDQQLARLYYLVEYSPDNLLAYALSGSNLNDVAVISVTSVASLPYLYYGGTVLPSGMVYFVQSIGILAISSSNKWIGLDGVVLRTDTQYGNVAWVWGNNTCGQIGDNTTVNKSSPVSVIGGFTDWCQISTGAYGGHTFAIRQNGTLWSWGNGGSGRLGDGSAYVNKSSPVSVIGGFTDWCQVAAGLRGGLAVRTNGTAWAWGYNGTGALGDNTTTNRSSPVSVVGGFTDWCQVAGSGNSTSNGNFSLGVRTNGTAWGWGFGGYGRLGNGSYSNRSSPTLVSGGFTDWCQVSAGLNISLGVRQNGTAWGIGGRNTYGNIGNGGTNVITTPVIIQGGFTDWCQVSAGARHSLGVRQNGTAWAWGKNYCGAFGDGTTVCKLSPVSVIGGFTDWRQVSAGYFFSIGIRGSGTGWAWGQNNNGQLGDNTCTDRSSPVSMVGNIGNWWQVSVSRCTAAGVTFE